MSKKKKKKHVNPETPENEMNIMESKPSPSILLSLIYLSYTLLTLPIDCLMYDMFD